MIGSPCGMFRALLLGLLLVLRPADDDALAHAARRTKRARPRSGAAGQRDAETCAVGARGWKIAPRSRFEENAPPCQFDRISMAEAGDVFVKRYEGQRPLIVTGATADLPLEAFSRCARNS